MDSLSRSRSTLSKQSRSRHNSSSRLTPNIAAAMLSLRWPSSANPRADNEDDSDTGGRNPRTSNASTKLHKKKSKSNDNRNNNNNTSEDDEPIEYEPVTIPEFHEVQTAWPGFDHEPVPNWQTKYMIAKPYPRNEADVSTKSSYIKYSNDHSIVSSKNTAGLPKGSKSRSKSKKVARSGKGNGIATDSEKSRSKRIIRVERVGSCLK